MVSITANHGMSCLLIFIEIVKGKLFPALMLRHASNAISWITQSCLLRPSPFREAGHPWCQAPRIAGLSRRLMSYGEEQGLMRQLAWRFTAWLNPYQRGGILPTTYADTPFLACVLWYGDVTCVCIPMGAHRVDDIWSKGWQTQMF